MSLVIGEVIGHWGMVIGHWSGSHWSMVIGHLRKSLVNGHWSFKEVIGQWSLVIDKSILRGFFGLRHVLIWIVKKSGLISEKIGGKLRYFVWFFGG